MSSVPGLMPIRYASKAFPVSELSISKIGLEKWVFLEIIQDLAKTEPDYEVRIANNVVHVATNDIARDQNFLNLKIPQFSGTGVAAIVKEGLWMLLNQQIAPNRPKGYGGSISLSPSDPRLDLQFTNASVEEILDRIALTSDHKVWIVTFAEDPQLTPTGFRRTGFSLRKRSRQMMRNRYGIYSCGMTGPLHRSLLQAGTSVRRLDFSAAIISCQTDRML